MNLRDKAALVDIINSARCATEFVEGMNQTEFRCDRKTQSAVLYQIAILGEAVKRLSPEFRS